MTALSLDCLIQAVLTHHTHQAAFGPLLLASWPNAILCLRSIWRFPWPCSWVWTSFGHSGPKTLLRTILTDLCTVLADPETVGIIETFGIAFLDAASECKQDLQAKAVTQHLFSEQGLNSVWVCL